LPVEFTVQIGSAEKSKGAYHEFTMDALDPHSSPSRRWTDRLLAEGSDPDPRFTLANERTTLAWSRTTLSLLVAGLLCVRLAPSAAGAGLAAAVVCGSAALQLRRARRTHRRRGRRLRAGQPVADPLSILLATTVTMLLGLIGVIFALA
jgi:uncharacterized membrane protein YidH (DUF202 family)